MPPEALSLKKHITVAGNDILTMCENEVGKALLKKIEREATYTYKTLTVPNLEAANCVFVNDTLMHKGIEDIGDPCFKVCNIISGNINNRLRVYNTSATKIHQL